MKVFAVSNRLFATSAAEYSLLTLLDKLTVCTATIITLIDIIESIAAEKIVSAKVEARLVNVKKQGLDDKLKRKEIVDTTYLNRLEVVLLAEKLPKSGPNAKYIVNGKILIGGGRRNDVKSLDIEVTFKNSQKLYLVHKYTMEDGGAQDNQFREAKETLKNLYTPGGKIHQNLGAVLDGDYYVKKRLKSPTKLEQAKEEHPDAFICTYKTFKEETKTIWSRA
jgi:hypothetical protein